MNANSTLMGLGMLCAISTSAQESLPYYCDFEENGTDWVQYRLGPTSDEFYTWEFVNDELTHYYPVGGDDVTDDWMVSPEFDFSNGATLDSVRHKSGGFGFPFGLDTIALYLVNGAENPDLASTVTLLFLYTHSEYSPDNTWQSLYDIEIPSIEGESHIAFRYKTDNNWLDISLDDLYISGAPLGIIGAQEEYQSLGIYPNPAENVLNFTESELEFSEIRIYTISGMMALQENLNYNTQAIDISELPNGMYTVVATDKTGMKTLQKLVIAR